MSISRFLVSDLIITKLPSNTIEIIAVHIAKVAVMHYNKYNQSLLFTAPAASAVRSGFGSLQELSSDFAGH